MVAEAADVKEAVMKLHSHLNAFRRLCSLSGLHTPVKYPECGNHIVARKGTIHAEFRHSFRGHDDVDRILTEKVSSQKACSDFLIKKGRRTMIYANFMSSLRAAPQSYAAAIVMITPKIPLSL